MEIMGCEVRGSIILTLWVLERPRGIVENLTIYLTSSTKYAQPIDTYIFETKKEVVHNNLLDVIEYNLLTPPWMGLVVETKLIMPLINNLRKCSNKSLPVAVGVNNFEVKDLIDWDQSSWRGALIRVLFSDDVK